MGERCVAIEVAAAITIMGVFDWVACKTGLQSCRSAGECVDEVEDNTRERASPCSPPP
jgi:hypothetical protein